MEGCDNRPTPGIRLRVLGLERTHHVGGARSCDVDGDTVAEPRDDVQPVIEALCPRLGAPVDGKPQVGVAAGREVKSLREHATDDMGNSIDHHGMADHVRVGAEPATPEAIGDNDRGRPTRNIVFDGE